MSYKIIVDSCCDLTQEDRADGHFSVVPLTLIVGEQEMIDDETFNQADFLKKVRECSSCPKSACPSPQRYMEEYDGADDIYVVTLSDQLSGSYNSAENGRRMYTEEHGEKNIHVFNSISAAAGEVLLAHLIHEKAQAGMEFAQIVEEVEHYKASMATYFVLETLDTLKKNGRLTGMQAIIATTLNIKPIMRGTRIGSIEKAGQCRGFLKALMKMVEDVNEDTKDDQENRIAVICHCNNEKAALAAKEKMEKTAHYRDIIITDTAGVSSMYANDGGVIISA